MSLARTLRTARHIPAGQLMQRVKVLWRRRRYAGNPAAPLKKAAAAAAGAKAAASFSRPSDEVLFPEGMDAVAKRAGEFSRGQFVYLGRKADFAKGIRWKDPAASPLWLYQLHYLGSVADLARTGRVADAAKVLDSWRAEFEKGWDAVAWHPYPVSLRFVNLCVAAACAGGFEALGAGTTQLAAVHAAYLLDHVERDVRGNHILENARALAWAGRVFEGDLAKRCEAEARAILAAEVPEQVLRDGGHFEMSPMYHCIVMRDLLEIRALWGDDDPLVERTLAPALQRMGEFLASILCPDGGIPCIGDSVRNFGPPPLALLALLGMRKAEWKGVRSFGDTGLHVFSHARVWAIFDTGEVCPAYLPAHGQADTLTVEVWIDGVLVVCDPGVHDYSGPERAWGRSSKAHSTLTLGDADTSEVYDNFRVGGRAEIVTVAVAENADEVVATIRPWNSAARLSRSVRVYGESLTIEDWAAKSGGAPIRSRLHVNPDHSFMPAEKQGRVTGMHSMAADVDMGGRASRVEWGKTAREFGASVESKILVQEVTGDGERIKWIIGPARPAQP